MNKLITCLCALALISGCQRSDDGPVTPGSGYEVQPEAQPTPEETPAPAYDEELGELADYLEVVLAGVHRSEVNRARDPYRNPVQTLAFFGVTADATVMEINPGGGWYMEVLAPLLNAHGQYVAATPDPSIDGLPGYFVSHAQGITERIESTPELYGNAQVQYYDPSEPVLGEPDSVDIVLTFRNMHGWYNNELAETMLGAFYQVLKPGGVLGVVQHRAAEGADPGETSGTGYLPEAAVIALAEAAGFVLDERSDINANPADTRDHPRGVWTLPPVLALGDENREHWLAIGESDRMTLRFKKPD